MVTPSPLATRMDHWMGVPSGTVRSPWLRWSMAGRPVYRGGVASTRSSASEGMAKGTATNSSDRQPLAKNRNVVLERTDGKV